MHCDKIFINNKNKEVDCIAKTKLYSNIMNNTNDSIVNIGDHRYYKMECTGELTPFFINVCTASDVWFFISSQGPLTAGRKNAEFSLFPYETEDKLHQAAATGPKTIIMVGDIFWEPFHRSDIVMPHITRYIYKSIYGCKVMFEEINSELGLTFRYTLHSSEKYGVVKSSEIINNLDEEQNISILDGMQNIMPYGVASGLQATASTLVDAYKASEIVDKSVAVFSMTSLINDTPNPIEVLRANIGWTTKKDAKIIVDTFTPSAFCRKEKLKQDDCYGKRSAFFIQYDALLPAKSSQTHDIVLDSGYDHCAIAKLLSEKPSGEVLHKDIQKGVHELKEIVAGADGISQTDDGIASAYHYSSTMYNVMRGGTFEKGYDFDKADFLSFVAARNKSAYEKFCHEENSVKLDEIKNIHELKETYKNDETLYRMALEFMPLSFSRRHGDPTRPWNRFNIHLKDEDGNRVNSYEGNWRDIFQNWEALGTSFPAYYENMIAKFVNASTIDGFNPYRIYRDGIDWEKPEEGELFSGFGYWGDHQIIYLLRLLNGLNRHFPSQLKSLLSKDIFTYANVPYRINEYSEILKDSKNTIKFDWNRDSEVEKLCETFGTDAKLVISNDEVLHVSLLEKLFIPLLSKMSNLYVGGGVWMNTQRPEWNDANNAIVGIGLSMVTVYHMHGYVQFLLDILKNENASFSISSEVVDFITDLTVILSKYDKAYEDSEKTLLDEMGERFSAYRTTVYKNGFSGKKKVSAESLTAFLKQCELAINETITRNKGELYTTYNLLHSDFSISPMRGMLEGQSAVIGSGLLNEAETLNLLKNMEKPLLDTENGCHYLYPVQKTALFYTRNTINIDVKPDNMVIIQDVSGIKHFAPSITTQGKLEELLEKSYYNKLEKYAIIIEFERIFGHKSFTGRSQNMYKFEGIGCVYWHQNAKLTLAVLEVAQRASALKGDVSKVYDTYRKLTNGFVFRKPSHICNAIPIEPYSHTSFNKKSEQPGMTGQVKESILMRRGELGVIVEDGAIKFNTAFVNPSEYQKSGKLSFSVCAVPVIYTKTGETSLVLELTDGTVLTQENTILSKEMSEHIFYRDGAVKCIKVTF